MSLNGLYPGKGTLKDPFTSFYAELFDKFFTQMDIKLKKDPQISILASKKVLFTRDVESFLEKKKQRMILWKTSDWMEKVWHSDFVDQYFWFIYKYLERNSKRPNFRRLRINSVILRIISDYDFQFRWIAELIRMRPDLFVVDQKDILQLLKDKHALYYLYSYTRCMSILGISPPSDLVLSYAQDIRGIGGFVSPETFYLESQDSSWYEEILKIIKEKPEMNTNGVHLIFEKASEGIKEKYRQLEYG